MDHYQSYAFIAIDFGFEYVNRMRTRADAERTVTAARRWYLDTRQLAIHGPGLVVCHTYTVRQARQVGTA
jgi:hypothetical protein